MSAVAAGGYPFGLEVDGPQPQNRLSVLLRILYVIPQVIVMYFITLAAGIVGFVAWLMILFTGKYPGGMANFSVGALRWSLRVNGYMFLLTDKYPPFSLDAMADYPVRFDGTVAVEGRNRLTCFFRYFMIIPHIIVLALVLVAAEVCLLISWFVALFTGSVPPGLHTFLAGTLRWASRVNAYYLLLTDEYPPFSLS
jgi:hypothetical protein